MMISTSAHAGDRDPYFDNAKFLLICLVVVGHSWGPIAGSGSRTLEAAYMFVYAFHMPAFILLSGYFSRHFTSTPEQVRKLVRRVLVPYLIFETVYALMYTLVFDDSFSITPTDPRYLSWYLVALFIWRLSAPVWRAVPHPLPIAVLVSVGAGLTTAAVPELELGRVLMFLPWFVLGMLMRPEHFALLGTRTARLAAVPALLCAAAGAYLVAAPRAHSDWLLMHFDYVHMGVAPLTYVAVRGALFVVSAVLVAAVLALVPGRRTRFTVLGTVTLYPYLLHGLVIKTAEGAGLHDAVLAAGPLAIAAMSVCAPPLALLLSSAPVRFLTRPLVEPPVLRRPLPPAPPPVSPPPPTAPAEHGTESPGRRSAGDPDPRIGVDH